MLNLLTEIRLIPYVIYGGVNSDFPETHNQYFFGHFLYRLLSKSD